MACPCTAKRLELLPNMLNRVCPRFPASTWCPELAASICISISTGRSRALLGTGITKSRDCVGMNPGGRSFCPWITTSAWSSMVPEWQQSQMTVSLQSLGRGLKMSWRSSSMMMFRSVGTMASSLPSASLLSARAGTWVPWPEKWKNATSPGWLCLTMPWSADLMFLPVGFVVLLSVSRRTLMSLGLKPNLLMRRSLMFLTSLMQPLSSAEEPG
mmetsp:Transcript_47144/g.151121  ORF Transcript_47144/g.151121 Transcript_47144/m.151121 type:complete len:214 (-) Transcript_47144:75-716(-)